MDSYKLAQLFDRNGDLSKRWYVGYSYRHPETGKNELFFIWISSKLKTKHARRVKANKIIEEIDSRLKNGFNQFEKENISFTNIVDAINNVLDHKKGYVRHRSYLSIACFVRIFISWLEKNDYNKLKIESFSYQQAIEFTDYLTKVRGIKPRTYNNYLIGMKSIFNFLIERDYILRNPFKKIKKKPESERTIFAYSESELNKLRNTLPKMDPRLWLVAQFIFYCAIRPAELVKLKIRNIDIDCRTITVPGEISKNRKTSSVTIPESFIQELINCKFDQYDPDFFIFSKNLMPGTKSIWPTRLSERFNIYSKKVGIDRRLYDLKHTAIGLLSSQNANINDIMLHCRHSDLSITQKYLDAFQSRTSKNFGNNYPVL